MSEFYIARSRTEGMSQSEISSAIRQKALPICPCKNLSIFDIEHILDGLFQRGVKDPENTPRCLEILELGVSPKGVPVAKIAINTQDKSRVECAALCTYCDDYGYDCAANCNFDFYEILQDDPAWNKAELARLLDEDNDDLDPEYNSDGE